MIQTHEKPLDTETFSERKKKEKRKWKKLAKEVKETKLREYQIEKQVYKVASDELE